MGSNINLREWQTRGLLEWERHSYRGCIEVATGGGKTFFAIQAYLRIRAKFPSMVILVIVPTVALLDQWVSAFEVDLGADNSEIKVLSSSDLIPSATYNVVVINTARKFEGSGIDFSKVMLVVDECHRAGSAENAKALVPGSAASLGLSATPYRDYDEGFENFVVPVLGPVILRYSLQEAIRDKVLAPLNITYLRVPLTKDEQDDYSRISAAIGRSIKQFGMASSSVEVLLRKRAWLYNSAVYRLLVGVSLLDAHRGKRTLVFVESIDVANRFRDALMAEGHSVAVYHSQMSVHMRRSNLAAFRRGIYDILVACRALDEGFNVPEAELALIAAGTSSRRQRVQRFGRVLRVLAGKNLAEVISLYATPVEEERLIVEADNLKEVATIRWVEARVGV